MSYKRIEDTDTEDVVFVLQKDNVMMMKRDYPRQHNVP
jgi:hypothetical protein